MEKESCLSLMNSASWTFEQKNTSWNHTTVAATASENDGGYQSSGNKNGRNMNR